jgi:hypothetical protein
MTLRYRCAEFALVASTFASGLRWTGNCSRCILNLTALVAQLA